ncbi:tricarballylate utilization protein TcuB [Robbsia sp. Bb-Pol-6]|uniref:Tricarballylate utilization protein TcuB n=1 Tax=Robbsia betulipollinis TaxID=2981849 RepID=A0ABT3ZRU5_9BURK|nr:tricarballylate utilization protein TcuB [Robbsia betulipollinis]MCY0389275.1 tricarballylate utilization protein TcuB [Robbsia betulipollinis]
MLQLEALTREAADLGSNRIAARAAEAEVARVMQICNACRYCEGFCAVFPAMTHRLAFAKNDIHFLANLCHNCGSCLQACQYAPPHEFAVNVPRAMSQVRLETYTEYAWPPALGVLYKHNGATLAVALAAALAVFLALAMALKGTLFTGPLAGHFYAVFPHNLLAGLFGVVFLFAMLALGIGVRRFWRRELVAPTAAMGAGVAASAGARAGPAVAAQPAAPGAPVSAAALAEATHDALSLRYLGGGHGEGCNNADDAFSLARRRFHHLTFYGFMLCFASTCVATLYHYLFAWEAPYALTSAPVILGTVGGLGLLAGPLGLLWLNLTRQPLQGDARQKPMDRGFILLLLLVSVTGLVLLAARDTGAMSLLLAVHLGAVMALFLTLPYGKFAHGIYRSAALLKWNVEKRNPPRLNIGGE